MPKKYQNIPEDSRVIASFANWPRTDRRTHLLFIEHFSVGRLFCVSCNILEMPFAIQGTVVQSVVTLTSSLVVKMLTVLVYLIHRYFC